MKIGVSSSSSGSTNSVRTRYRVGYPPLGLDLRMNRQTGFAKAAAMFGMSDTEVGDAEFDEAFSIRTSDPQRLSARLSPATRRLLLDLVAEYRSVKITDEQLSYEKNGAERDAGALTTTARRLIEAAQALQGASAEPVKRPAQPVPVRRAMPPPPPPPSHAPARSVRYQGPFRSDSSPTCQPIPTGAGRTCAGTSGSRGFRSHG